MLLGLANYFGWHNAAVIWGLHLSVMIVGIVFLFSLFAVSKNELPGMVILSMFLLALGVVPFESVFYFHSDNLVGIVFWGVSLLAGCLIPLSLSEKGWGDRFSLSFLCVWLIIWPISAFSDERRISIIFETALPAVVGTMLFANNLIRLLTPKPESS